MHVCAFHMWRGGVCTYVFYLESCMCFLTRRLYARVCYTYIMFVCVSMQHDIDTYVCTYHSPDKMPICIHTDHHLYV